MRRASRNVWVVVIYIRVVIEYIISCYGIEEGLGKSKYTIS